MQMNCYANVVILLPLPGLACSSEYLLGISACTVLCCETQGNGGSEAGGQPVFF